jgi:3-hydroxyacyl-CoA dehydrogenase
MSATIKNVTVIGGGLMGSGVAQVAAQSGHKVTLVDVNDQVLKKAKDSISGNLNRVAKKIFKDKPQEEAQKFVSGALANLSTSTDALESAKTADLVLEAIVENIDVKHKLFSSLDAVAPKHTIFASNTSSLSIEEIAKAAPNRKVTIKI